MAPEGIGDPFDVLGGSHCALARVAIKSETFRSGGRACPCPFTDERVYDGFFQAAWRRALSALAAGDYIRRSVRALKKSAALHDSSPGCIVFKKNAPIRIEFGAVTVADIVSVGYDLAPRRRVDNAQAPASAQC